MPNFEAKKTLFFLNAMLIIVFYKLKAAQNGLQNNKETHQDDLLSDE
jgi:hypothetical protein